MAIVGNIVKGIININYKAIIEFHFITKSDVFNKPKESSTFSFNNRYLVNIFYSIMLDIRAAGVSIAEKL
jgi:hypothetical protein